MLKPSVTPNHYSIIQSIYDKGYSIFSEFSFNSQTEDNKGRYLHWDQLKYRNPPKGYTHESWWASFKFARNQIKKPLPLHQKNGELFSVAITDLINENLHYLDQKTGGMIAFDESITNPDLQRTFLINSLIDEAIQSSILEGAVTTRKVAKNMILKNRKPADKYERMVLNNYKAMRFIKEIQTEKLTPRLICFLHKIVTEDTLDDPKCSGQLRKNNEVQVYDDQTNEMLHDPPDFKELENRMQRLCTFANSNDNAFGYYLHPIVKGILLHFMLAYDHPFEDGNGRTARALFYWYMAHRGHWMVEYISISWILRNAFGQYRNAFLYTEHDEGDTSYFVSYQIKVILQAMNHMEKYLAKKRQGIEEAKKLLEGSSHLRHLNFRQLSLIRHAMKNPGKTYTVQEHGNYHNVVLQTARTDLKELSDNLHIFKKVKSGNAFLYISPENMKERIQKAAFQKKRKKRREKIGETRSTVETTQKIRGSKHSN